MRKSKIDALHSSRPKQLSSVKNESSKNKNLKIYKSIEKTEKLKESEYFLKISQPNPWK